MRGEEGVCVCVVCLCVCVGGGGRKERKRTYERQEAPVGSPAEHLSLKRLLLSITISSPLFSVHLFCLATGGTAKGERVGA